MSASGRGRAGRGGHHAGARPRGVALPMALLALAVVGAILAAVSAISLHELRVGHARGAAEGALADAESAVLAALAAWDPAAALAHPPGGSWTSAGATVVALAPGTWWVTAEGRDGSARRRAGAFVRLDRPAMRHRPALLAAGVVRAEPGAWLHVDAGSCPVGDTLPLPPALVVRRGADGAEAAGALRPPLLPVVDAGDSTWADAEGLAVAIERRASGATPLAVASGGVVHAPGGLTIPPGMHWTGALVADGPLVIGADARITGIVVARAGLLIEPRARIEGHVALLGGEASLAADAAVIGTPCRSAEAAPALARAVVVPGRGWVDVW